MMKGIGDPSEIVSRVCAKEGKFARSCIIIPANPGNKSPKNCSDGFTFGKGIMCNMNVNYGETRIIGLQLSLTGLFTAN